MGIGASACAIMLLLRSNRRDITKKSIQSPGMFSSHEVRWFLNGSIEQYPMLRAWVEHGAHSPKWSGRLGGKPDAYIVIPGAVDMGMKWREGQLQIKGLESSLGTQVFRAHEGHHAGKVERWMKWSYEGKSIESAFSPWFSSSQSGPKIVEVQKTRCLRKIRINPFTGALSEVDASASIDRGGVLEVTDLRVGERSYCSMAFEAFPNDSAMHGNFTTFVNTFLETLPDIRLEEANSMSYTAWLQTL